MRSGESAEKFFNHEEEADPELNSFYETERQLGSKSRFSRRMTAWKLAFGLGAALIAERKAGDPYDSDLASLVEIKAQELKEFDPDTTKEQILELLKTFPDGYVRGDLKSIGYTVKEIPEEKRARRYGDDLTRFKTTAHATGGEENVFSRDLHIRNGTTIVFHKASKIDLTEAWKDAFPHELGHTNDWTTDADLSPEECKWLRDQVVKRLNSTDRFISSYVERITDKDTEKEVETRAQEYWAEIVSAYLNGTPLAEEDKKLVEWSIKKNDSEFNRNQELANRNRALNLMRFSRELKSLKKTGDHMASKFADWAAKQDFPDIMNRDRALAGNGARNLSVIMKFYDADKIISRYAGLIISAHDLRLSIIQLIEFGFAAEAYSQYSKYIKLLEDAEELERSYPDTRKTKKCAAMINGVYDRFGLFYSYD